MSYQPYLIANFATGINDRMQPWLTQDEAQQEMFDGFVYRGVLSKRFGYRYFATGQKAGTPYRESRIVHTLSSVAPSTGVINGINRTFTFAATGPIARGSITIAGSNPVQSFTDNGLGYFLDTAINISAITNANPAAVTTAINHGYTTGDQVIISSVSGMTEINSISAYTITVTGLNSFTLNGVNSLGFGTYTSGGTVRKVVGTVNYTTGAISITFPVAPIIASTVLMTYSFMSGNPVMMVATYVSSNNTKEMLVADTRYVNRYNPTANILSDISPATPYTGTSHNFFTWVNYPSALDAPRLLFCNNVDPIQQWDGATVTNYAFTLAGVLPANFTCSFMVQMKDRLILLRTTENATVYPQRIRISGTGANSDIFDSSATGAGFIDIPDGSWIQGAAFNRDDLIIFTEGSTWIMKYTGNDTVPFVIDRLDYSRGSKATFSAITYLNRTSAASPLGLVITDGYSFERMDEAIPDFSFNEIDPDNFDLCFAGSVDQDRDHYLIYPPPGQTSGVHSKRILITNYEEDTYAKYRLPLSCMGTFYSSFTVTWNDLLIYNNWNEFAAVYSDWLSFPFTKGQPITIGGGHKGEIWELNITGEQDNPVNIRNITIIDTKTIEVTTDWNNFSENVLDPEMGKDMIFFTGINGMEHVNNQQYAITTVVSNYVFRCHVPGTTNNFEPYMTGGTASRVIPFEALTKKFNPYVGSDKKVRCGWLYMYVDSTDTSIEKDVDMSGATQADPCVITTAVPHGLRSGLQVAISGVSGMTQLNENSFFITVLTANTFSLNGIDSSAYGAYVSGGIVSFKEPAKIFIDVIVSDDQKPTQVENPFFPPNTEPYQGNCTNLILEGGSKKWYKIFINQVGKFIQFRLRNQQAGATINIQAMMPGFQPLGRLL
jgi:hypothetical protein